MVFFRVGLKPYQGHPYHQKTVVILRSRLLATKNLSLHHVAHVPLNVTVFSSGDETDFTSRKLRGTRWSQ
jgi:hypothetical protein